MKAQAALRRPPRDVVLHPVALEHLDWAVVPLDGEVDGQFALWSTEHGTDAGLQSEVVGSRIELG